MRERSPSPRLAVPFRSTRTEPRVHRVLRALAERGAAAPVVRLPTPTPLRRAA